MKQGLTRSVVVAGSLWFSAFAALPAQSEWQLQGGRMRASVVTTADDAAQRAHALLEPGKLVTVASGEAAVHFPSNAAGKPMSLQFATVPGDYVNVAVAAGAVVSSRTLEPFAAGGVVDALLGKESAVSIQVRTIAATDDEMRDYRVSTVVEANSDTPVIGIVTRHHKDRGCYLFSVDWNAHKLRLERWMGGHRMIVRELHAPWLSSRHTLAMQVQGFRLQCWVDDEVVLQSFDGAFGGGLPGVAWTGEQPKFAPLRIEPVVLPLASVALVQQMTGLQPGNRARVHAAVPVAPGHLAVLELLLDRPHPWVPRSVAGLEPSLMQPFAAPIVLWGDWRNSLGQGSIGEVSGDGTVTCELQWSSLAAIRLRTALARFLLVTPDGERIVAITPAVRVSF